MKKMLALLLFCVIAHGGPSLAESGAFTFDKPAAEAAESTPPSDSAPQSEQAGESQANIPWTYPVSQALLEDPEGLLILANKQNLLDKEYPDEDTLVDSRVRKTSGSARRVRAIVEDALQAMFAAADAEGIALYLHSAYRSHYEQAVMYENRLKSVGRDDGVVQLEGASDHQTGLGVDVISKAWIGKRFNEDFAETKEAVWMAENAPRFGFVIRYPKGKTEITGIMYEPWHLRYVGADVAIYMTKEALTLEEFTDRYRAALAEYRALSSWNMNVKREPVIF